MRRGSSALQQGAQPAPPRPRASTLYSAGELDQLYWSRSIIISLPRSAHLTAGQGQGSRYTAALRRFCPYTLHSERARRPTSDLPCPAPPRQLQPDYKMCYFT